MQVSSINSPNKVHWPRGWDSRTIVVTARPMLGAPLGTGPAHVVQFRPVGVEQGVREGAEQPRSPAMEESVDLCFIHVSVLLRSDPLSRSYKLGFCLSAPNICALKPGPLATGSLGDAAAGASAASERR